eukprot:Sspe_Gene.94536::Locus_66914_Transcript_1_1_Confidence_1.000_Length_901::g.94536::m.94536
MDKPCSSVHADDTHVVFNVSGVSFEVRRSTITAHPDTTLAVQLTRWDEGSKAIYLDRDAELFRHILAWYRNGKVYLPGNITPEEFLEEATFYNIPVQRADILHKKPVFAALQAVASVRSSIAVYKARAREKLAEAAAYAMFAAALDDVIDGEDARVSYQGPKLEARWRRLVCPPAQHDDTLSESEDETGMGFETALGHPVFLELTKRLAKEQGLKVTKEAGAEYALALAKLSEATDDDSDAKSDDF